MKWPVIVNPIRGFAVLCVAVIAAYIMWMGWKLNETLSGSGWCAKAIGADKADADSKIDIAASCVGLLTIQLRSLSTNSHILFGVVALCLLTLIVIVIAGGKLSLSASKTGINANIGKDAEQAAQHVADEAQGAADEVKADAMPGNAGLPPELR